MVRKLLAALTALALTISICSLPSARAASVLSLGDEFPDFSAETTAGTFSLSQALAEKEAALVIFWATWCPPCEAEFPYIQSIYEQYGDRLAIVALSIESTDTMDVIADYASQRQLTFPMGRDDQSLFYLTGQTGIPTPVLVDRFGRIGYMQAGALPSQEAAERLVSAFLGDAYTETLLLTSIPEVRSQMVYPADEELSAALNEEDILLAFTSDADVYEWPFLPVEADGRKAATASNGEIKNSRAVAEVWLAATEGDVLALDYKLDTDFGAWLEILDNGTEIFSLSGDHDWSTLYLPLSEGGHGLELAFVNHTNDLFNPENRPQTALLANVRVLSDEEARTARTLSPHFPISSASAMRVMNTGAERVKLDLTANGTTLEDITPNVTGGDVYVVPDTAVLLSISLDASMKPGTTVLLNERTGETFFLSDLLAEDGSGYSAVISLSQLDEASGGLLSVSLVPRDYEEQGFISLGFMRSRTDAEILAQYVEEAYASYNAVTSITYEPVGEAAPETVGDATATYTITVTAQDGAPVAGVVVNICTDETCKPMETDAAGQIVFASEITDYHLQVLRVPAGYSFNSAAEYHTGEATEVTVPVTKN